MFRAGAGAAVSAATTTPLYVAVKMRFFSRRASGRERSRYDIGGPSRVSSHSFDTASISESMAGDRKSTRLNSSHRTMSYAAFCLKKTRDLFHGRKLLSPPPNIWYSIFSERTQDCAA